MITCLSCGASAEAADRYCATCGEELSAVQRAADDTGTIARFVGPDTGSGPMSSVGAGTRLDLPIGTGVLVVHRGPGEGTEYHLEKPIISIGRSPDSDIFLDDVTVSCRHAELRRGAPGWSVRDSGSLNGTYVNRRRVDDRLLQPGDELQIGKFRFAFLVGMADTGTGAVPHQES